MSQRNANAVSLGSVLGFFNTLFISIALCIYTHESIAVGIVVFLFGIIPGLVTGSALGAFANATSHLDVWLRRLMLCVPAIGVLLGMAELFSAGAVFLPAVIPTIVCALILERQTRYVAPVPLATAY